MKKFDPRTFSLYYGQDIYSTEDNRIYKCDSTFLEKLERLNFQINVEPITNDDEFSIVNFYPILKTVEDLTYSDKISLYDEHEEILRDFSTNHSGWDWDIHGHRFVALTNLGYGAYADFTSITEHRSIVTGIPCVRRKSIEEGKLYVK